MATMTIDNQQVRLPDGEAISVIEAARGVGIEIPHYCWHPALSAPASCRRTACRQWTRPCIA